MVTFSLFWVAAYDFRVDKYEPNRVWFTTRFTATHTGPLKCALPLARDMILSPLILLAYY